MFPVAGGVRAGPPWFAGARDSARSTFMTATVKLFGIAMNRVNLREAVHEVQRWVAERDGVCRYVVTPNVDHTVMFQENLALREAYEDASLVLADGAPVV